MHDRTMLELLVFASRKRTEKGGGGRPRGVLRCVLGC